MALYFTNVQLTYLSDICRTFKERYVVEETKTSIRPKNRRIAALLAMFLGTLGIHSWYLGNKKSALLHFLFSATAVFFMAGLKSNIPLAAVTILCEFEAIKFALMSEEEWQNAYTLFVSKKKVFL